MGCLGKARPLGGHFVLPGLGVVRLEDRRQHFAETLTSLPLDQDEAPGNQFAMVRDPGCDLQERLDLLLARPRLPKPARRDGAALQKAGKAVVHGLFIQLV